MMSLPETTNKKSKVPEGYKQTAVGVIPEDWKFIPIKSIAEITGGFAFSSKKMISTKSSYQVVKMSNVYQGELDLSRNPSYLCEINEKEAKFLLENEDIILSLTGTIGKRDYGYSVLLRNPKNLLLNQRLCKLKVNKSFDNLFIGHALKSDRFLYHFFLLGRGGTGNQANVGTNDLKELELLIPPLAEQQKIAAILTTWDEAIEKTQKLIDQLKQRNKGLAQQLLTGKKRLKGFKGEWKHESLELYFKERKEFGYEKLPLLSVGESGVYLQSKSNKKDTSNEDKALYKRICVGDIGYNTMRMWQGRSALSELEGIVSPAYTIVTPRDNADAQFFSYLFKLDAVIHKFYRNSQGLVSDTWNCKFKDFKIVKVDVPASIQEQKAIAQVLNLAKHQQKFYEEKLTILKEQKKGLMQKLLTGEIRVKI